MPGVPYPANLTPNEPPFTYVRINEYWWSVVFGFAETEALKRSNWDVTDEQWEVLESAIIDALDTAMLCDCIHNLSYDPANGVLSYTDGDGNTVVVQSRENYFEFNNYTVIKADEADADDAYCYAAWLLTEKASDDLQDMLEAVDVLEDATVSVLSIVFSSLIDLVPLFGDLAEAVVEITDNLAEQMYDWVRVNAKDADARAHARQVIYCGIKAAMEGGGGQSAIRAAIVTEAGNDLIEFGASLIDGVIGIPDLFDAFENAYNALDGELLWTSIVAYLLLMDTVADLLGTDRPMETIMAHATKHAAGHDSRDCSEYCGQCPFAIDWSESGAGTNDWAQVPNFGMGTHVNGVGWQQTVGFYSGFWRTGVYIEWSDETIPSLSEVHFTTSSNSVGNQQIVEIVLDHAGGTNDVVYSGTFLTGVHEWSASGSWTDVTRIAFKVQLNGSSVDDQPHGEVTFGGCGGDCG